MAFLCLICAHDAGGFLLRKESLVLARCRRCGFIQQDPLPAAEEYDARYHDAQGFCAHLLRDKDIFLRRDEHCLRRLMRGGAAGPLLDVGAGPGILMEAARSLGWNAVGLELSQPSVQRIRGALGMVVHACAIELAPLEPESFGVVTFSHSLEHLRDPVLALRSAAHFLRPGGVVHIAVPHWRAVKRLVAGTAIPWIGDQHISYFTARTLSAALRSAGLDLVECRSVPMVCDVDYSFVVAALERANLDVFVRRFLRMDERRLGELLTDNVQVSCPSWRLRFVVRAARACLKAWPEGLFSAFGWGEELRATARRRAPG